MSDLSIPMIASIAVTFFVAGIVKGVTGMGLPTVAMAVLGSLISPLAAAPLLIVPSFVTNVWQLFAGPSFSSILRRLWPMMLAIIAGTVLGSSFIASGDTILTTAALGGALALYSLYTLFSRQLSVPTKIERWMSPSIGAATGLITGVTGVFTLPAVPYLQALGLSKDDLVQALGLSFTISTIALAAGIAAQGAFQLDRMTLSVLAVIPALAGMWAGQLIRDRISPVTFRRGFLVLLFLLGAEMAFRPLF
ncbi:sulfite exporter TauE/SafE family protein [Rhizobium sp. P32RR-XVIII]|uniref:sulfite exporter TauE/SafE family protein n=1 Tax=Rhizobium sp. P32RR-XVIII TaxID=2726738 RepID=UPI0014572B92|nr:sulfite exporter TauE/SafE family protein [Rhizobium sp. P32RR-XVIII]NLS07827.1 sulfite exporter TauE/SafE family protein [Rhizobium sp. P32RR-XVIII]